jgi:hypothetical protein
MILVTGMQRSGTSMVCQLLAESGVSFGDPTDLLPGDRWNPNGYFEARSVMDVNSRLITGLPRFASPLVTWLSKVAYVRMPGPRAIAARAERCRAAVVALAQRHRGGAVKDPRFCLTLRFWQQWTAVDRVVVCVRHPSAVVESMVRRHWLPRRLGARFYAWHIDALLDQLDDRSAQIVDVDRLVAGSVQEVDALRRGLGLAGGPPSPVLLQRVVRAESFGRSGAEAPIPAPARAAWQRLSARAAAARAAAAATAR